MSNSTYGPIEIFRAGTFQPMAGAQATITERDLQQIADNYDPVNYPAPIVIGHPAIDAPAYGWVDKLYVEGGKLKATVKEVVTQFADMVKEGRYRKVSISMFTPENTANPKPGEVYLKHVGFLGAAAPAVPGLKPVQFSNGDVDTLCFTQDAAHATQSFAQQQELTLLRREVAAQKVEKLVNDGKVLPALRDEVLEFAASLDDRETLNFADTGETTRRNWFMSYLERQPKIVTFGAFDFGNDPVAGDIPPLNVPDGYSIDPVQNDLYQRARRLEREKGVSFADAVDLVRGR